MIAEWMTHGNSEWDTHEMDVARFHAHQLTDDYITKRSTQNYIEVYDIIHPKQQMEDPRNLRVSPWHARQIEQQAEFFVGSGWELPQWYQANADLVEEYEIKPRNGSGPAVTGLPSRAVNIESLVSAWRYSIWQPSPRSKSVGELL